MDGIDGGPKADPMLRAAKLIDTSNEKMYEAFEDKLFDMEGRLAEANKMKHDMGVTMFGLQNELKQLRTRLAKVEAEASQYSKENSDLLGEREMALHKYEEAQKKCMQLDQERGSLTIELRKQQEYTESLMNASRSLNEGMKAQKLSESSAWKQVSFLESQMKLQQTEQDELENQLKKLKQEKECVQKQLELQEHETKLAQRQLEKVVDEMQIVAASKNVIQQHWQTSIRAMSKRDEVLEKSEKKRIEAEEKLHELGVEAGGVAGKLDQLEREVSSEKTKRLSAQESLSAAQNEVLMVQAKKRQVEAVLTHEKLAAKRLEEELRKSNEKALRFELLLRQESQGKQELLDRIRKAEEELRVTKESLKVTNDQAIIDRQRTGLEMQQQEGRAESTKTNLERKLNKNIVQQLEHEQKIETLEKENETAIEQARAAIEDRDGLVERARHLELTVLRQGNKINKLSDEIAQYKEHIKRNNYAKLRRSNMEKSNCDSDSNENMHKKTEGGVESDDEVDPRRQVQMLKESLAKAQKTIKQQSKEIDTLRLHWSKTETGLIKAQQNIADLRPKASVRDSEMDLLVHTQNKSRHEIRSLQKDLDQTNVRMNLVRVKQRRANEEKNQIQKEAQILTYQLGDAQAELRESKIHALAEMDALKTKLVESQRCNKEIVRRQLEAESRSIISTGKRELMKERYEITQRKLDIMSAENQKLKHKVNGLRNENSKLSKELYKVKQHQAVQITKRNKISAELITNHTKSNQRETTEDEASGEDDGARDLRLKLLQAESNVTAEREKLVKLESMLENEKEKSERLGKAFLERDSHTRELYDRLVARERELGEALKQQNRAVNIAKVLEYQLLEEKSATTYINYEALHDIEPSPQLQDALNGITKHEKSNPTRPSGTNNRANASFKRPGSLTK